MTVVVKSLVANDVIPQDRFYERYEVKLYDHIVIKEFIKYNEDFLFALYDHIVIKELIIFNQS